MPEQIVKLAEYFEQIFFEYTFPQQKLSTADSDGDGLLTEEEVSQLRPDGPPPPPPGNALGGRLDSETATQLLDALQTYAEENEDVYGEETSLEQLIADFIEDITGFSDTSSLSSGLLVNTSA